MNTTTGDAENNKTSTYNVTHRSHGPTKQQDQSKREESIDLLVRGPEQSRPRLEQRAIRETPCLV